MKRKLAKIKRALCNPKLIILACLQKTSFLYSDKAYLNMLYYLHMGKRLHLSSPKTFNEKLNWLKLYNRKPEYTRMVDKYTVKEYVAEKIGEKYIIPTLGVWDTPEEIDWDNLPKQFVLKTTHGGGNCGVIICKDKSTLDISKVKQKLRKSLKQNLYKSSREWPYKNIIKKIIAEPYLEDQETKELRDYKFFCFDGDVKALFVATERSTGNVKFDFYDSEFNHLNLVQTHPMSEKLIEKPKNFNKMKEIASTLSSGIPHVRVDLYNINGIIYFGEITFYHHGGLVPFHPEKWDYEFGNWIKLPNITQ